MNPNVHFSTQQCPSTLSQMAQMRGVPYLEAIGSVLWSMVVPHPNTVYAVRMLSQFIQNPGLAYWEGVKRLLISYLGHMKDLWLIFGGSMHTLLGGYCDTNWASQLHHHSISRFSFHYGQNAVSWSSKKQSIITLSSTIAEYVAETHAAKEGIWLKTFVKTITGEKKGPLTIMTDNQEAIVLTKDDKFHTRIKHMDLRYHFVHEAVEDGKIMMKYIPTSKTWLISSPRPKPKFTEFVAWLGLAIIM